MESIDLLFSSFIFRCRLVRVGFLALEYSMVLHSPPVNPSYFSVAKPSRVSLPIWVKLPGCDAAVSCVYQMLFTVLGEMLDWFL